MPRDSAFILVGVLVIGILGVVYRYARQIKAARQRVESLGSQVIETDCGPIEYARVGDGYPVLVLHGDMGGFDQGLLTAKFLTEKVSRSSPFRGSVIDVRPYPKMPPWTCR